MFDLEPPTHAQRWRNYNPTPEQVSQAVSDCIKMATQAEEDDGYNNRCVNGEKVFYYDYYRGLMPGHIYSEDGMREFKMSGACEFHFDEWFAEDEEC